MYNPSLPPIISCRFILNLRQVQKVVDFDSTFEQCSGPKSIDIRFVGNMGQSLHVEVCDGLGNEDIDVHRASPEVLNPRIGIIGQAKESKVGRQVKDESLMLLNLVP